MRFDRRCVKTIIARINGFGAVNVTFDFVGEEKIHDVIFFLKDGCYVTGMVSQWCQRMRRDCIIPSTKQMNSPRAAVPPVALARVTPRFA